MSLADALTTPLIKVTDAMTECGAEPIQTLGFGVDRVGSWMLDRLENIERAIPVKVTTRKRDNQNMRAVFELGRDAGRAQGKPRDDRPIAPVRHLHSV